jgi:signal transduction histidine kinase
MRHGHSPRFGRKSVFVKLLAVFAVTALGVAGLFAAAGRQIWQPTPGLRDAISVNFERFASDIIHEIGEPPLQQNIEKVARERKFAVRVDGPEGTLMSEPGLPDPRSLHVWRHHPLAALEVSRDQGRLSAILKRNGRSYLFSIERDPVPFLKWTWWAGWMIASLAILAFAFSRVRRIFRPLQGLTEAAEAIAGGQLDFRLPVNRRDELGHLQQAFNRMAERIQGMIQGREQLLRDVSHELRSPLARVKVAAALLPDSKLRESVEEDVRELQGLVDLLLERSRLEASAPLQESNFDWVQTVDELLARFSGRKPGFAWTEKKPAPIQIRGDRDRLKTAIRNLLENAAKYAADAEHPVQISMDQRGGVVVRDFGPGVPVQDAERIFDPFQRGDLARTKNTQDSGGFGLGLDLARRIARAHGGDLRLRTDLVGGGAAFEFSIDSRRVSTES